MTDNLPVRLGSPFTDMAAAMEFTKVIAHSELIPKPLRGKPANVLAVVLYGQDVGLSQMQAMQNIHVVEGKPTMSAELWRAKLREHKHRYYIPCRVCGGPPQAHPEVAPPEPTAREHPYEADQDDRHCRLRVIRGDTGERGDFEYTLDEAIQAGKLRMKEGKPFARSDQGKPLNWETHTRDMLYARVTTRACRAIAPEIALGWVIADEADEIAERERFESVRLDVQPTTEQDGAQSPVTVEDVEAIEAEFAPDAELPPCGMCGLSVAEHGDADHEYTPQMEAV